MRMFTEHWGAIAIAETAYLLGDAAESVEVGLLLPGEARLGAIFTEC